jgi:hypothetical protein
MKLVNISGKKKVFLKTKLGELESNSKIKNIRDLYRGINELKESYQPITSAIKVIRVICLQTPRVF